MAPQRSISFDAGVLEQAELRAAQEGRSLDAFVNAAVARAMATAPAGLAPVSHEEQRKAYLAALIDRDARRAREIVESAVAAGVGVLDLYTEVIGPVMGEVGHLWAVESINVAQEHFATTLTLSLLGTLAPTSRLEPTLGRLAIVTSTPGELHLLGAHMVADLLERDGWEVIALGADTPAGDLVELIELECPDLVALSTSTAGRLPGVAEVLTALRDVDPRPFVAVGGALFSSGARDLAVELGADLVGADIRQFIARMREEFPPPAGG